MKAAFLLLTIAFLIYCILRVARMLKTCYNKRRTRAEMRDLPRLEVTNNGWQRRVQNLPPRVPPADPSPTPSSCPSYHTATAPMPTGLALYEEMAAAQVAMKLAKTMAVNPVPRPHPSSSNGVPDMETVMQNMEEHVQTDMLSNLQDTAQPPVAQGPPSQDTVQPSAAQRPASAAQAPASAAQAPASAAQAPASAAQAPASAAQAVRAADLQEPADSPMNASLARMRKTIQ